MSHQILMVAGQVFAGLTFFLLVIFAFAPRKLLAGRRRMLSVVFVFLWLMTILLPIYLPLARVHEFLGRSPFRAWSLVALPLSYENLQVLWPEGICYVTVVHRGDDGILWEQLLPNNLSEPMNISGLSLGLARSLSETEDRSARIELADYLFRFLDEKLRFHEETGRYNISRRWLRISAFPTANEHRDPPVEISRGSIEEIRVYRVRWCGRKDDYRFRRDRIEWCSDGCKELIATYRRDQDGRVAETGFANSATTITAEKASGLERR